MPRTTNEDIAEALSDLGQALTQNNLDDAKKWIGYAIQSLGRAIKN